ncbi:MAG: sensory transduction histidine kinase [Clostridiales bacterium]|nr:sensory transduction histidine kinase [Clostridiales bacterium]
MRSKISIAKKLFIITTVVFGIFISGTLIIQSVFFESFYINKKRNDLKSDIERFRASYNKTEGNDKIAELIGEYEGDSNIKLVIWSATGKLTYMSETQRNRTDYLRLMELTDFIMQWVQVPGSIENLNSQNKTILVRTKGIQEVEKKLISITPNKENGEIIFAISSLQNVSEASSVIRQFYIYFFVGAAIIVTALSLVYSKMIAKPLVKINRSATKMANLDFSEKCSVNSNDEIGNVAASLNFLSENLDNALTNLRTANAKLEEDIEKERDLERMRKEFVASVSHELKTPITLIDGYAVGLKDEVFEGKEKDFYLDVIIDEARKMGHLVTDMLDLSQLESGNFKLTLIELNLKELVVYTIKKYEALIAEKSVKIETSLIDNIRINADWERMEQVLTNFITNAIRHVDENGTIKVSMIDKGEHISVEVENTGSHMPEDEMKRIWDKFYKFDKSRNRKFGGTGIGLSIVKNILTLHGYEYGVSNTVGGVKFYFSVPKME